MHVLRSGVGSALLLQHGFLGGSGYWAPQIAAFRRHFEVLAPDLPGFADSSTLVAPRSIRGFADALIACLDREGIPSFSMVGHSMGGMIAQQVAALVSDRLERLVLYGTSCSGELPGRFETFAQTAQRIESEGMERVHASIAAKWFVEGERHPLYELCRRAGLGVTAAAAQNALEAMTAWRFESELHHIRASTLVIGGDRDRACSAEEALRLWRGIPGAGLCIVPGCSHNVHLERSDLFNHVVLDFLTARQPILQGVQCA